ncbi:peptidoglycan DD-metalloendopeptidase family protein [Burkholderia sp. Ax-1719]|uniref:peptidoglycan DD-metalloendopeptidase family protein n=1 Tax=Burkholderia sp. Ax-1719 TaxID=2608334 RepID=UPI0014205C6F|nr:peptidoglycan DD-metalloendopeptidase family protein [Burkholderia sp. Ax-1719]NIE68736.1 peptidoglycan DD-metalloendopeptidase family protein [Burkholderia sp. Ax-1719]
MLGACANVSDPQAPQPQPDPSAATSPATDAAGAAAQAASTPVKRTVTKTTYVRVRRGDSLQRIASAHNVSVRDLTAWNHLKPNGRLRAGQSLKLVSTQTIIVQQAAPAQGGSAATANTAQSRAVAAEVARHASSVALMWPARGHVLEPFEPGTTRGIEIGGKAGDPVLAAADGKVMYAGTGLNEYGSLIIVQHNKDFLTAYSHNRRLLVKTGDTVHQGQQIAEMGNENNDRVAVLFEVRRDGKPVDPMPYLPTPQS